MMEYRKILIRQFPQILFAHGYKTDHYAMSFPQTSGKIEITFVEQGSAVKTYADGRQLFIPAPGLEVSFYDSPFSMRSDAPTHRHSTVGFQVEAEEHRITQEQIAQCGRSAYSQAGIAAQMAILPEVLALDQQGSHIEKSIKQIIRVHSSLSSTRELRCTGLLLELLAEITDECVRKAITQVSGSLSPGSTVYIQRAMLYISAHLSQKITVDEIAQSLEISSGYLSKLFKSVTGQTVIDYVNRVKLDRVKELITSKNATLKEAGESVGIDDENYLSRIFKKITGLTVREYKMLNVTL